MELVEHTKTTKLQPTGSPARSDGTSSTPATNRPGCGSTSSGPIILVIPPGHYTEG
jgi:hypothetical protein